MKLHPIQDIKALGFLWETIDPYLFCAHHEDYFPAGNVKMGPDERLLKGRRLGDDFIIKDGFRMYHGKVVPGFPGHPHRGFETVTLVRRGYVDHADSLGAAGRYGNGDVQWMTAGKGVQHSEMFPLLSEDKENTAELFQVWLNLPASRKMVEPHFKMLWKEDIPVIQSLDAKGNTIKIELVAGTIGSIGACTPPPDSWASNPENEVFIATIHLSPGATYTLPTASEKANRMAYFYEGDMLNVSGVNVEKYHAIRLSAEMETVLTASGTGASLLILQGRPISEPVVQYGPFVMNTRDEIQQAFDDYHATQFGGWPWPRYDQVHPREKGRFARHADGREEVRS